MSACAPPPQRPLLRYHGGKWLLAPWIISHFPPHRVYVEPYGGAASVLIRKPRCYSEVYNEISGDVVNLFQVVRDCGKELKRRLELTPYARDEYRSARAETTEDPIERARFTVMRSFMGFGSGSTGRHYNTGFRANANRNGTTPAHDWANYPLELEKLIERLRGVVIENKAALEVIAQQDTAETLFYCDPPYELATRNHRRIYELEMKEADHQALAQVLHRIQGKAAVSGYRCDLYDTLYAGWRRKSKRWFADGARKRIETIWMNY